MSEAAASTARRDGGTSAPAGRSGGLCLIVHDDMNLRLRLADLVRKALPALDADSVDKSGFAAMTPARIGNYVAVLLIVEFTGSGAGTESDPLATVVRLRNQMPRLPILVFGRGGDERSAARSMKMGATDYWPIHSVKIEELGEFLKPLVEPAPIAETASRKPAAGWRQPEIAGYRLLKKIAQSASATVYLARNDDLPQPVALKVQPFEGLKIGSEADRQRFARECEILSGLNHRSIADVLDFGITAECLYLALEYFPCGSLRERLRNPVSETDAVNYASQIGEALQVVHAAHIVHCDLKPSNVMLTNNNRVVLIDFGSARSQLLARDLSLSDLNTGTPYYVCPEQVTGRTPDARSDLYSLGIVLYEMLAGKLPFESKTLTDLFAAHRSAQVPRLPKERARYQPVVDRLLAKNPDDRYASAVAFLEALRAVGPTPAA